MNNLHVIAKDISHTFETFNVYLRKKKKTFIPFNHSGLFYQYNLKFKYYGGSGILTSVDPRSFKMSDWIPLILKRDYFSAFIFNFILIISIIIIA